jgi:hypothetical protein
MTSVKQEVISVLKQLPNLTRYEIADLIPDRPKSSVLKTVQVLEKSGRIVCPKDQMKPNPQPRGPKLLKAYSLGNGVPRKAEPLPLASKELEELRAFRAMALERHPELAVPEVVMRARGIVIQYVDKDLAALVKSGRKDECPIMKAVVHALEEVA